MGESGIYQIRSIRDGKLYIGSAIDIRKRWMLHINRLNLNKHHAHHLHAAWVKYGPDNFVFEVIEYCDKSQLIEREQHYLDALKPEYNTSPTAGSRLGMKATYETRAKTVTTALKKWFLRELGRYPTEDEVNRHIDQCVRKEGPMSDYVPGEIANEGVVLWKD